MIFLVYLRSDFYMLFVAFKRFLLFFFILEPVLILVKQIEFSKTPTFLFNFFFIMSLDDAC